MPSILTSEAIKQQERLENQLARERGEREEEDKVVAWWCEKMKQDGGAEEDGCLADPDAYECSSFIDFLFTYKSYNPNVSQQVWDYFNYEHFLYDLVKSDDAYTLLYKDGDTYKVFPEVPPAWKGRECEWLDGHPCKDCFYVLRYTQE
jgi:hypothetical protein